jgi:hypothetical protein
LDNFKAAGMDGPAALNALNDEAQSYQMLLDPNDIQNLPLTDGVNQKLIDRITPQDFELAFGDGNGNFDEAKAKAYVWMLASANPEMGSVDDQESIAGITVKLLRSAWSAVRNGAQTVGAWYKIKDSEITSVGGKVLQNWQKIGVNHSISALFGAVALGVSYANSRPSGSFQIVGAVGSGITTFGNFLNGAGSTFEPALSEHAFRSRVRLRSEGAKGRAENDDCRKRDDWPDNAHDDDIAIAFAMG